MLKESVDIRDIMNDTDAYNVANYDEIVISDVVSGDTGWTYLGNGANQVFAMSTDRTSIDYKKTMLGIPTATGHSLSGTTEFGNDGVSRYLRDEMACLCGGLWGDSSGAGVFASYLVDSHTGSNAFVGGRASVIV